MINNQTIDQAMTIKLGSELPAYPEFVPGIRRAPDRGYCLTPAQTKLALKNALRYVPEELHEALAPEFLEELKTYGRIYAYRYRPQGRIYGKPIEEYKGKCLEGKAFQVMIDNNLDFEIALYPYELVTYGETGQPCQNWLQYRLIKKYLEELTVDQTLVVESGHPVGLFPSKPEAPRVILTNALIVGMFDNLKDWVPLPVLTADTRNLTPQNGSFTSGFDRGRCVVTSVAENPALVCAWLDQMYAPMQSPQNNWGTYGEDDDFDIFEMGKNADGEDMLKHAPLGDASPVEVREAEAVGGPLAILDEYYDVYVTCPDDAQYRLDWIEEYYTPDMHTEYVYPNIFMSRDDTEKLSNLQADIQKAINAKKADWIMNGFSDADWDKYLEDLEAYGLSEYLKLFQTYLDSYNAQTAASE